MKYILKKFAVPTLMMLGLSLYSCGDDEPESTPVTPDIPVQSSDLTGNYTGEPTFIGGGRTDSFYTDDGKYVGSTTSPSYIGPRRMDLSIYKDGTAEIKLPGFYSEKYRSSYESLMAEYHYKISGNQITFYSNRLEEETTSVYKFTLSGSDLILEFISGTPIPIYPGSSEKQEQDFGYKVTEYGAWGSPDEVYYLTKR